MLTITDLAKKRVLEFMKEEREETGEDKDYVLRVETRGGGCNDLSYNLQIDHGQKPDDTVVDVQEFKIVIDPKSKVFLEGIHIDYKDALVGGGFKIDNPQATGSCECGNSFSV